MTPEEKALLLTTARVLRAHMIGVRACKTEKHIDDDIDAVTDALKPFDGIARDPIKEAAGEYDQTNNTSTVKPLAFQAEADIRRELAESQR